MVTRTTPKKKKVLRAALIDSSRPMEEKLLQRIFNGEPLSSQDVGTLTQEVSPADFNDMLAQQYALRQAAPNRQCHLHEEALYRLVELDTSFLGNPLVLDTLKAWRLTSPFSKEAKNKLKGVGAALIPAAAKGHSTGLEKWISPAYEDLVEKLKRFKAVAAKVNLPGKSRIDMASVVVMLSSARAETIRLAAQIGRLRHVLVNVPAKAKEKEEQKIGDIESQLASATQKLKEDAARYSLGLRDLDPAFADFRPEWVRSYPGKTALRHLSEALNNAEGSRGVEAVKKARQRARKVQGKTKSRLTRIDGKPEE